MKNSFVKAAAALALASGAVGAQALVLDFNDLVGNNYFTQDYMGFQFGTNSSATNDWIYNSTQDVFNPTFGGGWVGTSCGSPFPICETTVVRDSQAISSDTAFHLNSVVLSGMDAFGGTLTLNFKLYSGNALVATEQFTLSPISTAKTYNFTYAGLIDSFVINGIQAYYAMDDINVTPVPEAGTWALMLAGMGVVGAVARRRLTAAR